MGGVACANSAGRALGAGSAEGRAEAVLPDTGDPGLLSLGLEHAFISVSIATLPSRKEPATIRKLVTLTRRSHYFQFVDRSGERLGKLDELGRKPANSGDQNDTADEHRLVGSGHEVGQSMPQRFWEYSQLDAELFHIADQTNAFRPERCELAVFEHEVGARQLWQEVRAASTDSVRPIDGGSPDFETTKPRASLSDEIRAECASICVTLMNTDD